MRRTIIAAACAALAGGLIARAEMGDTDDRYTAVNAGRSYVTVAVKGDRALVQRAVVAEASRQGVPHRVALAVAKIESGYSCTALGPRTRHGRARGPLQIMPKSAERFGYRGTAEGLQTCDEGLRIGMEHLSDCYRRAGGDPVRTASCHVGGPGMAGGPRGSYAARYVRLFERAMAGL